MSLFCPHARASLRGPYLPQPVLDFLAPSWPLYTHKNIRRAYLTTTSACPATASASDPKAPSEKGFLKPTPPFTQTQQDYLEGALRVNQAGELAATLIYTAQTPPIVRRHPHLRPLMSHMYAQEAAHLTTFNDLLSKHRVRPTALTPLWTVAATALGWGTAVMGRKAAMACTEAVETEIGTHYNEQVRELLGWVRERQARGEEVGEELEGLVETVRRIRDEELEHLDHAVENDAKEAEAYPVLTAVVRGGCKGAIWLSERV